MQGLKPVQDVKITHDTHAVDKLLESAKGMLQSGKTPDVVQFTTATLAEITSTVIPAIQDATNLEQALLHTRFATFEAAVAKLSQGVGEVHRVHIDLCTSHTNHFRAVEWKQESELCGFESQIHHCATGHFFAEDAHGNYIMNGTTHNFRETSVPIMNDFIRGVIGGHRV